MYQCALVFYFEAITSFRNTRFWVSRPEAGMGVKYGKGRGSLGVEVVPGEE